jgi:prolipoprotein diacylglyceryltransferase
MFIKLRSVRKNNLAGCDIVSSNLMNVYAICLAIGAALGMLALARRPGPRGPEPALNAGLILEALALIGARAGYVLFHPDYFLTHAAEIPAFWLGGLSWIGCAAGLMLGTFLIRWMFRLTLAEALRQTVTVTAPLAVLAWIGAWVSGVGYGPAYPASSLFAWPSTDETGLTAPRLPLQILCAALVPLSFLIIDILQARWLELKMRSAALSALFLSADLLLFAALRADPPPPIVSSTSPDILAANILVLVSLVVLIFFPASDSGKSRPPVS